MKTKIISFILAMTFISHDIYSQEEKPSPWNVSAEVVSSYVWRGSMATGNLTPNIQPSLTFTKGILELGVFGSTDFKGEYKEVDPYLSVTTGKLKLVVTDYNWNFAMADYFNYTNDETGHMLEGSVIFSGTGSFPLSVSWNTMFYGFDKKQNDTTQQAFSTYVELGYSVQNLSLSLGFSPWESYYTAHRKGFEVVNIGLTYTKLLKISEKASLPCKASLIVNPSGGYSKNDYVHLVFGIKI